MFDRFVGNNPSLLPQPRCRADENLVSAFWGNLQRREGVPGVSALAKVFGHQKQSRKLGWGNPISSQINHHFHIMESCYNCWVINI